MCTAVALLQKELYFGRTLDHTCSYGEEITVTPRRFPLPFADSCRLEHYAVIGTAHIADGYPLYYDAVNEKGLCMAGLHFVGNAFFRTADRHKHNVAPFECIPWVLSQCADVAQAKALLLATNLERRAFGTLPIAELHWLLADKNACVTVESTREGLFIYDNPVGVLTNNPPFPVQLFQLSVYRGLSAAPPQSCFSPSLQLQSYSRGMGTLGLPGDLTSQGRFVRAAFISANTLGGDSEVARISRCFRILGAVEQQKGCCHLQNGTEEYTLYTACCNADRGIYYYRGSDSPAVTGVDMHRENLESDALIRYPLLCDSKIPLQNAP